MKNYSRYLSILLTLAILLTSIPLETFAVGNDSTVDLQDTAVSSQTGADPEANIIGEVTEKRDKATKHFLKDDMSVD